MQQDVVKLADNDSGPELRVCVGRKKVSANKNLR